MADDRAAVGGLVQARATRAVRQQSTPYTVRTVVNGEGKSLELVVGPSIEDIDALPVSVVLCSDAVIRANADGAMNSGCVGTGLASRKHPHLDAHLVHRIVFVHICSMRQLRDKDSRHCLQGPAQHADNIFYSYNQQDDIADHAGSIPTTIVSWDLSLDELRTSCSDPTRKPNEVARSGADVFGAEIVHMSVVQRRGRSQESAEQ